MKKILIITFFCIGIIAAQDISKTKLFLGYAGDLTNAPIGFNGGLITDDFGFYISIKFDSEQPTDDEYMSSTNYNQAKYTFGDVEKGEMFNEIGFTAGITKTIFPFLILYSGISYYSKSQYVNFFDKYYILGNNGNYYVDGPKDSESLIGFNFGSLILLTPDGFGSFYLLIGSNINPSALELGIGYAMGF